MADTQNFVKFAHGTLSSYNGLSTKDQHTVYFITDAPYIFYAGKRYGNLESDFNVVKSVALSSDNKTLTISYSDGSAATTITIAEATQDTAGLMSAADKTKLDNLETSLSDNQMYKSAMDDSLATVEDLGGIKAGTTASDLKKMTLSEVFDELIFPTVEPTFVAPSCTLRLTNTSTTPTVQEVGTTGSTVPTAASFTKSFSKGEIQIAGTKKQDRSGDKTSESIYVNGTSTNTTLPTSIAEGSTTYTYRVNYAQGPQPLDSKGGAFGSALAAGHVDSSAVTVYGVYPYYTNATNNGAFAKLALTTSTTLSAVKFVAEGPNKHAFKLPSKYTLTNVTMLNTLSGKYEAFGTSKWDVTTENIEVQGASVAYKVYTRNDAGFNGESTFNITFSK